MMKKNILLVSDAELLSPGMEEWIAGNEQYEITIVETDEKAIELAHQVLFDLVIIDEKSDEVSATKLNAVLPILHGDVLLVNYQGEEATDLDKQVRALFERRKWDRVRRLLVLDATTPLSEMHSLPPFSAN
jgi:DNA-binding NarL/FixJ family response regulator